MERSRESERYGAKRMRWLKYFVKIMLTLRTCGSTFPILESIYRKNNRLLIELNLNIIKFFWNALALKTELYLQSELGVTGKGTELIINICKYLQADTYMTFPIVEKHLDVLQMNRSGIQIEFSSFHPPLYPQLWGEFIYNLSVLDMLLNCGEKSRDVISSK